MTDLLLGFEGFLQSHEHRTPTTVRRYVADAQAFLETLGWRKRWRPAALKRLSERDFGPFLAGATSSKNGWNNRLAALRAFFDYMRHEYRVESKALAEVKRHRTDPLEKTPLSLEEMLALVHAASTASPPRHATRNVAVLQLFLHSTLRVSEVSGLNLKQFDAQLHHLHAVKRKGGKRQTLEISDLVAEAVEHYLEDRQALLSGREQSALFVSDRGTRLSVRALQNLVGRYAKLAGIERPISPHALRHSSATALYQLTDDIRVVQELCGHASVNTTQHYVHVNTEQRRAAVNAFAKHWRAAEKALAERL